MSETIGIIGLGSAGRRHARYAKELGLRVIGYDPNVSVKEFSCDRAMTVDAMLSEKPLGVIVATPPHDHAPKIIWLAGYDVPVLVEKPLGTTVPFLETALDLWKRKSAKPLAVGYQFRHVPQLQKLKADIDAGKWGTIFSAHAEFSSRDWCSKTYDADFLLEVSHEIDLLRWMLLGTPSEARATIRGDIITGEMTFLHCQATFHLDGISPDYRRRLVLYGTRGTAFWHFDHEENEVAYFEELEDFVRVCRGEKPPECTAEDGYWALRMVEAIKRSAGSGRWETV